MRIVVTGKNGQLGRSIKKIVKQNFSTGDNNFTFIGKEEVDFTNLNSVNNFFNNSNFDIVINCAAYTKVDSAEDDGIKANLINYLAVKEIAKIAKRKNISLIHISTDYVFDGKKNQPYNEYDVALPINSYGNSKLSGDNALLSIMNLNAIIIRTGWIFSEFENNFVKTIVNLANKNNSINIVSDQFGTPTYATDIANAILTIINTEKFASLDMPSKLYNFSNLGGCSWFDFASEIIDILGIRCNVNPIQTEEYLLPAKRPSYSILNKKLIMKDYDVIIRHWKESLEVCLKQLK